MLPRCVVALLLAVISTRPAESAERKPNTSATPAWVVDAPVPEVSAWAKATQTGGIIHLLHDEQFRISPAGDVHFYGRYISHYTAAAGIEAHAQRTLTFAPSYQRLQFHGLWRWRDGRRESIWNETDVKWMQRESRLESNLLDGETTAALVPRDLRVGDTVELAYSVIGANPAFEGHVSLAGSHSFNSAIVSWRHRVLWPSEKPLFLWATGQVPPLQERALGKERELVRAAQNLPVVNVDSNTPAWYERYPWFQLSSYKDWASVADWAVRLFRVGPPSRAVKAQAERLRLEDATPAEQTRAALTFVQEHIRYLGVEIGAHSHKPHPPDEVLAKRFGDCKDKSLLLVTLLRELGIEAYPALVNTRGGRRLDTLAPSHRVFDHAIVQAHVDGKVYWLDPTRSNEQGRLELLQPPEVERALVVRPGETGLQVVPGIQLNAPEMELDEEYSVPERGGVATLTVRSRYWGRSADGMRSRLLNQSLEQIQKEYMDFYARFDPDIEVSAPLVLEVDDRENNHLVTRETYRLPSFYEGGSRHFEAHFIRPEINDVERGRRTAPLAIRHPVFIRHTIRVTTDVPLHPRPYRETVTSPAFELQASAQSSGNLLTLVYEYRSTTDAVTPDALETHRQALEKARDSIGYRITPGAAGSAAPPEGVKEGAKNILAMTFTFGVLGGLCYWGGRAAFMNFRAWRRRRAFIRAARR